MPKPKPQALHSGAATKEMKEKRRAAEASVTPIGEIPKSITRLDGHKIAQAVWKRLRAEYEGLQATIVTRLDIDMLTDYCLMMEQVIELDRARGKLKEMADDPDADVLNKIKAYELLIRLDARHDRKLELLLKWRQSLYLTPRARAGFVPPEKKQEEPEDELERLLNEVDLRGG